MKFPCRVCGVKLDDDNWYTSSQKNWQYICKECTKEKARLWIINNPEKAKAKWTRGNQKLYKHCADRNLYK